VRSLTVAAKPPFWALVSLCTLATCARDTFEGPRSLLRETAVDGKAVRTGAITTGGETRPALLASARFRVPLPRRPLLTFGLGTSYAGEGEAPGWFRFAVKADGRVLAERTVNPRAAQGWKDLSVPLEGLGRETTLEFDLRFTDRDGRDIPLPADLLLGAADPTIHDLDDYGRAKGVILVSIDTLRRDHVGAHGYAKPTTPRLDTLAQGGILCDDAVSTSSWTLPAHLSMLTSVDPGVHGGTDMSHGFNRRVPTLPALLRKAGFATQAVTSHLYVSAVYGLHDGFDHLDFRQDRRAAEVADRAIEILDRVGDRPFFLFLHLYDPHWHYDPPHAQRRLFAGSYTGEITGLWQDFSKRDRSNTTAADLDHLLALYDGEIRYADDEVGRVLDHVKARGLDRGTLVVVTSDHGEEFLEHGSWEHQKTLYEEVVRIPLVVNGPGVAPRKEAAQVSLLDVMPTVLAWAGLPPSPAQQGRSLLAPPGEREAYGETEHTIDHTPKLFLRGGAGRLKAIVSLAPDGALRRCEWYDLAADPGEAREAAPPLALADALRGRAIARWREGRGRGGPAPAVELTPEQRERLRALGYVTP
jgi:arylsulfatase A-like enzyme